MQISLIAALASNHVIGSNNQLPWHLPRDLQHFKQRTLGKSIIMGRATYASVGRPLPKRHNIVLTHQTDFQAPGCTVVHSLSDALACSQSDKEIMIIGGASLYQAAMPLAQTLYLTLIEQEFVGDTYFPVWEKSAWTTVTDERIHDDTVEFTYRFVTLQRKNS